MDRRFVLAFVFGLGVTATSASAVDHRYYNESDIPRMPEYCRVKFLAPQDSPEWKLWHQRIGHNFIDLHHYCAALNFMNRYWSARDASDRGFYLKNALDNFNYMVKAEKPDFLLRAELYSHRGEVFKLNGRSGEAERDFRHALEINPHLTRPYLQLIDLYEGRKQGKEALELATLGLRHNPDSKVMQRRYLELGGRKPFPEPFPDAVKAEAVSAAPDQAPVSEPIAVAPTVKNPDTETATPPATDPPSATIGSPKNPYCRFCPPE